MQCHVTKQMDFTKRIYIDIYSVRIGGLVWLETDPVWIVGAGRAAAPEHFRAAARALLHREI